MAIAVLQETRLGHETLEILLSNLADAELDISGSVNELLRQQHPVTKLLEAAHARGLGANLPRGAVEQWKELIRFKKLIRSFRDQGAEVYPGWDFGLSTDSNQPDSKVPVDVGNDLIQNVLFGGYWFAPWLVRRLRDRSAEEVLHAWDKYCRKEREFYGPLGPVFVGLKQAMQAFSELFGRSFKETVSPPADDTIFEVHTRNGGYQIQSTPQYWMSPVVFGSTLSSPVVAELRHGMYRFGGKRANEPIIWDAGIYTVSPKVKEASLTAV